MQARRWLIRGRVQGVGFRRFVQREAVELCLNGWVRNLDDGRVEAFAQGAAGALDALQGRLWHGPRAAGKAITEARARYVYFNKQKQQAAG